jgi:hypothetical protein
MTTETLERELANDLLETHERFADEKFCVALYRTLTRNQLRKSSAGKGHVTLSFTQAESLVNDLRGRLGQDPLTLAQTGDEGEIEDPAASELRSRGWSIQPATTAGGHDPQHDSADASPPPEGAGQREDAGRWAAQAHEEADAELRRRRSP